MYILCNDCHRGIRVMGNSEDVEGMFGERSYWHGKYKCYACESMNVVAGPAGPEVHEKWTIITLDPHETHLAMEGMGIPEERECAAEIVIDQFLKFRITTVLARPISNTGRSVIDAFVFEDGTKMFLTASSHGAQVYRIRKPHSYVKEMDNG